MSIAATVPPAIFADALPATGKQRELAGGLDDNVDAKAALVDRGRVRNRELLHGLAVDHDRLFRVLDRRRQPSIGGVELQQVCERAGLGLMARP